MAVMCEQVCISDGAHQCFKLQNTFLWVFEGCFWGYFFVLITKSFCARSYLSHISCWKGVYSSDNKWLTKQRQEQLITPPHHHKTPAAVQRIGSSTATWKKSTNTALCPQPQPCHFHKPHLHILDSVWSLKWHWMYLLRQSSPWHLVLYSTYTLVPIL